MPNLTTYDEELAKKRQDKERQLQSVVDSIAQIPLQQANIAEEIGKTANANVRDILRTRIEALDAEHKKLLVVKAEMEAENALSLRSLDEELQDLEEYWDEYPIQKRIALLNFLVQKVVIDIMSMHWLRIQIHWLHEEWGVEQLYFCRYSYGTRKWTPKDDEILRAHYPESPRLEVLKQLPERSWEAIRHRGYQLKIVRQIEYEKLGNQKMTYTDIVFMEKEGITEDVKLTKWERLPQLEEGAFYR